MNKKEQKEFDDAILQAKLARALRWTDPVIEDIPEPAQGQRSTGFYINGQAGWSESFRHGWKDSGISSQNSVPLFSTRIMALRALRNKEEIQCAHNLLRIDRMIDEELSK